MKGRSFSLLMLIFCAALVAGSRPATLHTAGAHPAPPLLPNYDIRAAYYTQFDPALAFDTDLIRTRLADRPAAAAAWSRLSANGRAIAPAPAGTDIPARRLQLRWNPVYDTPRVLFDYERPLTAPSPDGAVTIARRFLAEYRQLYGLDDKIDRLLLTRDYVSAHNGLRHVTLRQQYAGINVVGGEARFAITREGAILSVASDLVPALDESVNSIKPALSARRALALAAANIGIAADIAPATVSDRPDRLTIFGDSAHFAAPPRAQLVLFPMSRGHVRLAWQVQLARRDRDDRYVIVVDAHKGTVLLRHALTWQLAQSQKPSYRVYTRNSPQPNSPFVSPQPPLIERELVTTDGDLRASPRGWLDEGATTTSGNNVIAQTDSDGSNERPFRPTTTDRVFDFPLVLNSEGQEPEQFQSAAVTNLFYYCNFAHDYLYLLGFDEVSGNFQSDNFGRGGSAGDPVMADAQDGSGFNNASFAVSEDGLPPRMQIFLWKTASPKIDADYDAEVIVHEYVHGLTNRLVGGPQNVLALFGVQSSGMGEGWSDWYALSMLSRPGDDPRARYPFGSYVSQNFTRGLRRFPYTTDINADPLTYADLDPVQTRFDVKEATRIHPVGEIWATALWEVRADFIETYGFERGKQMIEQLVTDALKLSPTDPSMVDGRDAILLADQVNNNGANQCLIWRGFARRGLGFGAASLNGSTARVTQSFDLPPFCQRRGALALDRKAYTSGDTIKITLGDADLVNMTAVVTVTSAVTGDRETLILNPNRQVPGQFFGTLPVAFEQAVVGDMRLQSAVGDTITVGYQDLNDGQNNSVQVVALARAVQLKLLLDDAIEQGEGQLKSDGRWQITTQFARSPTHSWTDSAAGNYQSNTDAVLTSRKLKLSGIIGARLVFWQRYSIERDFDFGFVEVKVGKQPWQPIAVFTGEQREFRETVVDLSRFDGEKVRVRFRLVTDPGQVADGWYIDDVQIIGGTTN